MTGSVVNFLSALALINNGVREILPFIRYIAQYIDFEWNAIKRQDQGQGVVCAATWCVPLTLMFLDLLYNLIIGLCQQPWYGVSLIMVFGKVTPLTRILPRYPVLGTFPRQVRKMA